MREYPDKMKTRRKIMRLSHSQFVGTLIVIFLLSSSIVLWSILQLHARDQRNIDHLSLFEEEKTIRLTSIIRQHLGDDTLHSDSHSDSHSDERYEAQPEEANRAIPAPITTQTGTKEIPTEISHHHHRGFEGEDEQEEERRERERREEDHQKDEEITDNTGSGTVVTDENNNKSSSSSIPSQTEPIITQTPETITTTILDEGPSITTTINEPNEDQTNEESFVVNVEETIGGIDKGHVGGLPVELDPSANSNNNNSTTEEIQPQQSSQSLPRSTSIVSETQLEQQHPPSSNSTLEQQQQPVIIDPERRKFDAKLSIVYSYLQRQEYDKSLQQLQLIMKKYEKKKPSNQRKSSSSSSATSTVSASSTAGEIQREIMIELYSLRAQLYYYHLQQPQLAKEDYLTIFQQFSQQNDTVNDWLVALLQEEIQSKQYTSALSLFEVLLPIIDLQESAHLEQYLELLLRSEQYEKAIEVLDVQQERLSSHLSEGTITTTDPTPPSTVKEAISMATLIPYYLYSYERLNNQSQIEHYTLLGVEHNLTAPEQVGEMYQKQRQYLKAVAYYQQALERKAFEQKTIENEIETLQAAVSTVSLEEEAASSGRRRKKGLFGGSNPSSSSSAANALATEKLQLEVEAKKIHHEIGSIQKAIGLSYFELVQDRLNETNRETGSGSELATTNDEELLVMLQHSLASIQEAMREGVYDKQIRLFLAQFDHVRAKIDKEVDNSAATVAAADGDLRNDDRIEEEQVKSLQRGDEDSAGGHDSETAVRSLVLPLERKLHAYFDYESEITDQQYLAAKYFPRNRWVVTTNRTIGLDDEEAEEDDNESQSQATSPSPSIMRSPRSGLSPAVKTKDGLEEMLLRQLSTEDDNGVANEGNRAMGGGGTNFEQLFSSEKMRQGYEEE